MVYKDKLTAISPLVSFSTRFQSAHFLILKAMLVIRQEASEEFTKSVCTGVAKFLSLHQCRNYRVI